MTLDNAKLRLIILGLCMGATACDQAPAADAEAAPTLRNGVSNGGRMTLNTNAWIPASARDIHEFETDGTAHTNSFGYESRLTEIHMPTTPFGPATAIIGEASPDIRLLPGNNLEVEVRGPVPGPEDDVVLSGAELIGLTLTFDMRDPHDREYSVLLRIDAHDIDDDAGDLYEFERVDPDTDNTAPLCENSEDFGRLARVTDGMHVDGDTGTIVVGDPGLRHIGCLSSAPAKAVELGYEPTPEGEQAYVLATRIVRADYCADGHPYTYPGNLFDIEDNLEGPTTLADVEAELTGTQAVEAIWGPDGVLCVGSPRAPGLARVDIMCPTMPRNDGSVAHNWQPPSCDGYVDVIPEGALRMYSVTNVEL